jgi:hypothetical protein
MEGDVSRIAPIRFVLALAAATLATLAFAAGEPRRGGASVDVARLASEIDREADHVTALELAQWIRDDRRGLRVLDVRADSEYAAYHIPSAERLPLASVAALTPRAGETIVLYSEGGAHAAQAWVLLRAAGHDSVFFLRGGLLEWMDDVMSPTVVGDSASRIAPLSRYFGGVPRAPEGSTSAVPALPSADVVSDSRTRVERVRRRGC